MQADAGEIEGEAPTKGGGKLRLRTLADLDSRTRAARAVLDRRDAFAADLGGSDGLSAMQRELVDSAAFLGALREDAAASWLSGEPIDATEFAGICKSQRQIIADLGLKRVAHDITDHLEAYRRSA
ncbi:hypothetical protein GCM10010869_71730 [Mesorhizobium tianshanense]|uniref:Uncharacterized protein n=1 Tax=Mesorhizobium tianshanense TaxID=39844 RepID=A0A562P4G4_9HYPH|nr:hypothetical protein [Mesorhizobium tianshanense]TWI39140.1 hypothetical protein IQ26_01989 [Mesorhizobium tianshanense]GLS41576.1 hypothetical protein GCM10010869_71730 [Mesorhizobium tianshanense]